MASRFAPGCLGPGEGAVRQPSSECNYRPEEVPPTQMHLFSLLLEKQKNPKELERFMVNSRPAGACF